MVDGVDDFVVEDCKGIVGNWDSNSSRLSKMEAIGGPRVRLGSMVVGLEDTGVVVVAVVVDDDGVDDDDGVGGNNVDASSSGIHGYLSAERITRDLGRMSAPASLRIR